MKKETKYCQNYDIHLLNGEVIGASEAYDLPVEKGLVGKFEKADDNEIFEIGDAISGFAYIPKRSILFISENGIGFGKDLAGETKSLIRSVLDEEPAARFHFGGKFFRFHY